MIKETLRNWRKDIMCIASKVARVVSVSIITTMNSFESK